MFDYQTSPAGKMQVKNNLANLIRSELSKGNMGTPSTDKVELVTSRMGSIVDAKFKAGAKSSDFSSIVKTYLPSVINEVEVELSKMASRNETVFGGNTGSFRPTAALAGLLNGTAPQRGGFFDESRDSQNSTYSTPTIQTTSSNSKIGNYDLSGAVPSRIASDSLKDAGFGPRTSSDGLGGFDGVGSSAGIEWSMDGSARPQSDGTLISGARLTSGTVATVGTEVSSDEIRDYFNNYVRSDDDSFSPLLWLGRGKNPMLQLEALAYAKLIHNSIIIPVARYYKGLIYGDHDYPVRISQIVYGIVPNEVITNELRGSVVSRHRLGQAVNFRILGVEDARIVDDLTNGSIDVDFGTVAVSAGVHISLPFAAANGQMVHKLRLWSDNSVPGFIGYEFHR